MDFNLFELGTWNRLKKWSREAAMFSCVSISRTIALLLFLGLFMSASAAGANEAPVVEGLISDAISPQPAGTAITFTAIATDPNPADTILYRFWVKGPGTSGWEIKRDWSPGNSWTWPTAAAAAGTNEISVWVRDGTHADANHFDDEKKILNYVITPPANQPPVATSLDPNRLSPQTTGTRITWTAYAYDPDGDTILYRFWLKGPSTENVWKVMRDWSSGSSWTWATSTGDAGDHDVAVCVRDGKHQPAGRYDDCTGYRDYRLISPNQPPVAISLSPDRPSPSLEGAVVTWTATAYDPEGDTLYYLFWLRGPSTGNVWKVVRDWSSSNAWTWVTSPGDVGEYDLYMYVRDGRHISTALYDSGTGYRDYELISWGEVLQLTVGEIIQDRPSLVYADDGYVLAYQSWEAGDYYQGDIYIKKFGPDWNLMKKVRATGLRAYEDTPSLAYSDGYYYMVYVSDETGTFDIFMKKYDSDLDLIETRQLTSSLADQDRPSLVRVGNDFYLAYQSWEAGSYYGGDIFIERFDSRWNPIDKVRVTRERSCQDRPSLAYADGHLYVAYTSDETGNLDIFLKEYDRYLNFLHKRMITTDPSDQDYPAMIEQNGEFDLAYSSMEEGSYDIYLERYDHDWQLMERQSVTSTSGHMTWPSLTYSAFDGLIWIAYVSQDAGGWNIFAKPVPPGGQPLECCIVADFSSNEAYRPYTLAVRFYNQRGQLVDPVNPRMSWIPEDAVTTSDLFGRTALGTYRLDSRFGSPGVKTFRITATIDGSLIEKVVMVVVE